MSGIRKRDRKAGEKNQRLKNTLLGVGISSSGKDPKGKPSKTWHDQTVAWSLDKLDLNIDWTEGLDHAEVGNPPNVCMIIERLKGLGGRTWREIIAPSNKHDHSSTLDKLCPRAQARLRQIEEDDVDALFSFRVTKKIRLWGIHDCGIFYVVWWDPCHQVRPYTKPHT